MYIRCSRLLLTLLVITAFLAGCASAPQKSGLKRSKEGLTHWQAKGKLGIIANGKSKSVSFNWQNSGNFFDIRFHGALGIGSAQLKQDRDGVSLTTSKDEYHAKSAEALMQDTLGWYAPVSELRHWIKGIGSPQSPVEQNSVAPDGRLLSLEQQGWLIEYQKYHENLSIRLPKKIIVSRDKLKLTIIIKDWRFQD